MSNRKERPAPAAAAESTPAAGAAAESEYEVVHMFHHGKKFYTRANAHEVSSLPAEVIEEHLKAQPPSIRRRNPQPASLAAEPTPAEE